MSSNVGASCSLPPAEIAKLRMEQRKARRAEAQHKFREQRKARRAEAQRRRRQADPELRAREALRKRQRRRETTTDETRARHAERQRQRRQSNPAVRNADVEAKRQRRANASAADRRRESEARAERLARQRPGFDGARLQRGFLDRNFGRSCVSDRNWFDNDLTEDGSMHNEPQPNAMVQVLLRECNDELSPIQPDPFKAAASTRKSRLPDEDGLKITVTRPAICCKRADSENEMQATTQVMRVLHRLSAKAIESTPVKTSQLYNSIEVEIGESLNSSTCPKSTQEQAESSRPSKRGVDVAVETPRISDENLCKSSQASIVPIRIHRWTETKPLVHFLVLKLQKKV
ncbi:uncharacterized protein LOC142761787 isoform X1 [Rhipicephalus microplus]|uniref:uncharacterized protein LOC142761787 isoform X1 n=1 Tax=Rhipicephalus microplus TaxID=6941 RepID=UPI003F6B8B9E